MFDPVMRKLFFDTAHLAFSEKGEDSPEFLAHAALWAYSLSEFNGNVAEAERSIAAEQAAQLAHGERISRGQALAVMMYG